ncbi:MAG: 4Fe-4S binding protein [Candidatus Geothermincolia bacterium]
MVTLDTLRDLAGADLFGVADARAYGALAPAGHRPLDFLAEARSIVIIGSRMLDLPLDRLPATRGEYTANFHIANADLNYKLLTLSKYLEDSGGEVFPIPYREMPGWNLEKRHATVLGALRYVMTAPRIRDKVDDMLWENLSYRHMAAAAGLGELGVNNLLLTPEYGGRVRFVALLTDVELPAGGPFEKSLCFPERCGYACVRSCPAGALSEEGSPMDKARCLKYYIKLGIPGQSGVRCGLCVAKCPAHKPGFQG